MTPTQQKRPMGVVAAATGNGPGAAAAGEGAPVAKNKKPLVAMIAIVALVVAIGGGIALWKTMHPGPPPVTAPTEKLVAFVTSEGFFKMPYEKQKEYLGALDSRGDELEKLWRGQRLTDSQMGMAREGGRLGKYIGRMEKYFAATPGQQRVDYIVKVVDKIKDDPIEPDPQPGDKMPKRDKKWGKKVEESWPGDVQQQWKDFHKAINNEEDRRKKAAKEAKKAAASGATTQPVKAVSPPSPANGTNGSSPSSGSTKKTKKGG
jgi:hypothetical protein